ncbi:MAG: CBS domain-containing protein [Chloroflexi bacterium]|nr:CBS domain-containing protein [Chloroflexota bacterium]
MKPAVYQRKTNYWLQAFFRWLEQVAGNGKPPEWAVVMGTAILVGCGAGFGAVVFRWLIESAQQVSFDGGSTLFGFLGDYYFFFVPALGGLIVGPLVYFFAREAKGHGVPEVMEAVALKSGVIRPRVAVVKSLASSICIGSGGSVGREGPIVQIGSALGSTIGQRLNLSPERIRSLVACGAAGGISATFNAPIAGAIFALEIILGEIHASYFGAVVMSSVIADVIVHSFEGSVRAFPVPAYMLVSNWELILYALLGALAAVVAIVYAKLIYAMEDLFDGWKRFPEYLKPVVGGLILGIIGIVCISGDFTFQRDGLTIPGVFGVGYELIAPALLGELALRTALVLLVLKLIATAVTLGSGGSGGVFAPSLFLGAMLGMVFGHYMHTWFPESTAPAGAYALVGMAATFAGTAHAPATAILIMFEMTGDYKIILPLMFATVVSMIISRAIEPESIYTLKLTRRGVKITPKREVDVFDDIPVSVVMTREYDSVPHTMPVHELIDEFERTHHHGFPVLDDGGRLYGVVTLGDLEAALLEEGAVQKLVADIATTTVVVGYPDETMGSALWRMGVHRVGRLPIVDRTDEKRIVGVIRRADVIHAYEQAVAQRTQTSQRLHEVRAAQDDKTHVVEVVIPYKHPLAGKTVQEVARQLPAACILVSIRRGKQIVFPHGSTVIRFGDRIVALASEDCVEEVRQSLSAT